MVFNGKHKNVVNFWARDINTEMVTKIVAVRAVNFSIGPFCTEFRCEHFRDDDDFREIDRSERWLQWLAGWGTLGSYNDRCGMRPAGRFQEVSWLFFLAIWMRPPPL